MKTFFSILFMMISLAYPVGANATDFCAPTILNNPSDAGQYCPGVCTAIGGVWNSKWKPKTNNSCGLRNFDGSVCVCTVINSRDLCAPEVLNDIDDAKRDCPATCAKENGTWNGNWVGTTTSNRCSAPNSAGSICGCNYTGCSEIVLDYDHPDEEPPNWTASAWYTPCGSNQEAGTAWRATNWTDNRLSIATGTRIRIGPALQKNSSIDKVVTEREFHVFCRGTQGTGDADSACCRDANTKYPRTNVLVTYEPGITWTASISYTPWSDCAPQGETSEPISIVYETKPISIVPNTLVRIGPAWTNIDYIPPQKMSGAEVKVICFGKILGQGSGCCVVGDPKCPPKKQTEEKAKEKKETPKKTPVERKTSSKKPVETKKPEKAGDKEK